MKKHPTKKFAAKGSRPAENHRGATKLSDPNGLNATPSSAKSPQGKRLQKPRISLRERLLKGGWIWVLGIVSIVIILSFSAKPTDNYSNLNLFELELDNIVTKSSAAEFINENISELKAEQITVVGGNRISFRARSSSDYLTQFGQKFADNPGVLSSRAYQVAPVIPLESDLTTFALGMGLYLACAAVMSLVFMRKSSLTLKAKAVTVLTGLPLLAGLTLVAVGVVLSQLGMVSYSPHTYELLIAGVGAVILVTLFMVTNPETRRKLFEYIF